jgi:hypothetical protein
MKFARLNLNWTILAAAVWLAASFSLPAQESKPRTVPEIQAAQRVKQLTTLLQLTDGQREKIQPIVFEEFKSVGVVKDDEKLSLQEKFSKQEAIRSECKTKIKSHLDAVQLAKWDELEKKSKKPKK